MEQLQMLVVLRMYVDTTISRKSQNECHKRFRTHTSIYPVIRAHGMKKKKIGIDSRGRSRDFRGPWKICVSQYHRETFPDTIKHDIANCSHVTETHGSLSFSLPSISPPLFPRVIWFHHSNGKYCTQFPLKLLSCNLIRWRWWSASTLFFFFQRR